MYKLILDKLKDKYPLTRLLMEQFHHEKKKEEAKFCTNCGNKLESASKFCPECGTKVE